ncbi:MAG TPA: UDP-N-acetylmuramate dehydrogenase [Acidimicrobiales bacterium]|nr:UDP-N-acetylmuramate dehydrogenase [Acidimicrobiales bacterium]
MPSQTSHNAARRPRLSEWTTLGVGGPADAFVEVSDLASLADALAGAEASGRPVLVLGGGSNVVVADEGFPGTVARIGIKGLRFENADGGVVARVAAGEDWCDFVEHCVAEGLSGTECLSGIPGLVGATPVQNVGAYGQEVSDTVTAVSVWDRRSASASVMMPAQCRFGYRDSVFRGGSRYVVTEVCFRLERSNWSQPLRYTELAACLGAEVGQRAPLEETARAVIGLRKKKGMVLDPGDPDSRSVGSFFTNPVLDEVQVNELLKVAPHAPTYPAAGGTKVAAAWLVERAGFARGYRRGGAAISSKHALALTVCEGGSAADVLALAREIRDRVRDRLGVSLQPEPVLVGTHL